MSHSNYISQLRDYIHGHGNYPGSSPSARNVLSQRMEQAQIDQRVRNGDLRPGQRSLNDGS